MGRQQPRDGEERFSAYLDELAGVMGRVSRVGPMRDYCTGLLLPGERKSVEPIAAVTARPLVGRVRVGQGARDGAAADRAAWRH
jgi:SRSO17 transposase